MLKALDEEPGFLKAGFLGETSSGKTYTATLLAIATRKHFKLDGPIAMFDTEGGSQYVKHIVRSMTGKPLLGVRARSFDQLMVFTQSCITDGVSVALVDSIAHPWEELKQTFIDDINAARKKKNWDPRDLEFQDWGKIKPMWARFTELYLNSPLHFIICGRVGDIYEKVMNEERKRAELTKVGVRMQTEKNFGYEPSLLVEMNREQILEPNTHFVRRATVWKDRFSLIDGQVQDFQTVDTKDPKKVEKELASVWAFFGQHVTKLQPGSHTPIDTASKTQTGADETGDDGWAREKKLRTILSEEIQGEIVAAIPGQSADEKKRKAELIYKVFGTRSWTAVEDMHSEKLREGLARLKAELHPVETVPDALVVSFEEWKQDITASENLEALDKKAKEWKKAAPQFPPAWREDMEKHMAERKAQLQQQSGTLV